MYFITILGSFPRQNIAVREIYERLFNQRIVLQYQDMEQGLLSIGKFIIRNSKSSNYA